MLMEARGGDAGGLKKIQLDSHPQCALFSQEFSPDHAAVIVRYRSPSDGKSGPKPLLDEEVLTVPLDPDVAGLEPVQIVLHGSPASAAYRMGARYDTWFAARFGVPVVLVYIGDGRRPILGSTLLPPPKTQRRQLQQQEAASQGWLSTLTSLVGLSPQPEAEQEPPWINFSDVAPLLVTTEASLGNVSGRLPDGQAMSMYKFRPNVVVDGEDEWAEDFWAELEIAGLHRIALTANCARCSSINVDYNTGRPAEGEMGTVFKKLTKDRRVDKGSKWNPIFGRYAFLVEEGDVEVSVGDDVEVTRRINQRTVWDWPSV